MARVVTSIESVRARFTALQRPLAFFDGPGGTQVPDSVIDAIAGYLRDANANLGGAFETSRRSDALIADARSAAAGLLGATSEEVAFGANMTTLNFALSRTASREWRAGDEIVCTRLDHDGNVSPWLELAHDQDLIVRFCEVDDECRLDLGHLRSAALRPDARRRLSVGLQRCRNGDARRGDRTARARRGRTRLDRRRALRAARADRRRGSRRRRAALLALQVLRAAPRPRVRPQGARRKLAPLQGASRTRRAGRGALRDRNARARAPGGLRRGRRVPSGRRLGLHPGARTRAGPTFPRWVARQLGAPRRRRRWRVACPRSR